MHAISSYHGNRPTNTQTNAQTGPMITIHCTAKLSVQCNEKTLLSLARRVINPIRKTYHSIGVEAGLVQGFPDAGEMQGTFELTTHTIHKSASITNKRAEKPTREKDIHAISLICMHVYISMTTQKVSLNRFIWLVNVSD